MDITQIYNTIFAEWSGKRYGDTTLIAEGVPASEIYQCVSFIKIVLAQQFGIQAGAWGNATNYWYGTNSIMLAKFQKVGTTNVQIGDIVVLGFDHIGIANGIQSDTTYQQLDQNGGAGGGTGTGSDAIQVHTFKKSDIIGVLRPIGADIGPAYTVTSTFDPRQVQANKQPTNKYDIADYSDFNSVATHIMQSFDKGTLATVLSQVHHKDGQDYYMAYPGDPGGYNVADWDVYTPPAAPVSTAPAAPIAIPGDTTPYKVLQDIPGYSTSNAAANHLGTPPVTVPMGSYFVFNRRNDAAGNLVAINVTKTIGKSYAWINPADNVAKPSSFPASTPVAPAAPTVPTTPVVPPANATDNTWKKTLTPLLSTGKPVLYRILQDTYVHDMNDASDVGVEFKESDPDNQNTWLPIKYWFTRSGMKYLVPFLVKDLDTNGKPVAKAHWYGIPTTDIDTGLPVLESELTHSDAESERQYRKDQGRSTLSDDIFWATQRIAKAVSTGTRFLDGIIPIKVTLTKKKK